MMVVRVMVLEILLMIFKVEVVVFITGEMIVTIMRILELEKPGLVVLKSKVLMVEF